MTLNQVYPVLVGIPVPGTTSLKFDPDGGISREVAESNGMTACKVGATGDGHVGQPTSAVNGRPWSTDA